MLILYIYTRNVPRQQKISVTKTLDQEKKERRSKNIWEKSLEQISIQLNIF